MNESFGIVALLKDPRELNRCYGFTVQQVFDERISVSRKLFCLAKHLDRVCSDTGIARTTGGSLSVAGGILALVALGLAPVTGGASTAALAAVGTGTFAAVAGAGATLTAAIIKDRHIRKAAAEVKEALEKLEAKDAIVCRLFDELNSNLEELSVLCQEKTVSEWILDSGKWLYKGGYSVVYKGWTVYTGLQGSRFALQTAEFIQADLKIMQQIAYGTAAPGLTVPEKLLFLQVPWGGRVLVQTGGTVARMLSGALALAGIGFGIWDIVEGAKDINGSEHSRAYQELGEEIVQGNCTMEKIISGLVARWNGCMSSECGSQQSRLEGPGSPGPPCVQWCGWTIPA